MLFKPVYLAVCVLFTAAHASPGPVASGPKAVNPITIVNAGINETIFTFAGAPPLEVLLPAFGRKDQHATWDRYERRADAWVFKNCGTQQWLAVDKANDHLVTVGDESKATVFAVESAGKGKVEIKLPNADKVFEPIFDGTSMMFGRVGLGPATRSSSQRWIFGPAEGASY